MQFHDSEASESSAWWFESSSNVVGKKLPNPVRIEKVTPPNFDTSASTLSLILLLEQREAIEELRSTAKNDPMTLTKVIKFQKDETASHKSYEGNLLHFAILFDRTESAKWLHKHGCPSDVRFIHRARSSGFGVYNGLTAEAMALQKGHISIFYQANSIHELVGGLNKKIRGLEKEKMVLQTAIANTQSENMHLKKQTTLLTNQLNEQNQNLQNFARTISDKETQKRLLNIAIAQQQLLKQFVLEASGRETQF
eukprot:TRINITY_DN11419_c0_g1_i2.p1 TRINITY_DN11419_c0_g1~~TRINITY_DN11419_c0_g1_i2.p1  ORF type:complete len:253 (-),score=50.17 TRINITY_DN11419_c0_g1_i2:116-874(-)